MPSDKTLNKKEEQPTHTLIEKIKDGSIDPGTLGKEMRQQCVELFLLEGYGIPAIAQILRRSDKTIKRDIIDIHERNRIKPDPDFVSKQVGEMVMYARIHRAHLMRLARAKTGKTSEKAQAEYYAHRVNLEVMERLQSIGYLPSQAQAIVGDFYHHVDDKVIDSISAQVVEMEEVLAQAGEVPALVQEEMKKAKALTQKMAAAKAEKPKEEKDEAK